MPVRKKAERDAARKKEQEEQHQPQVDFNVDDGSFIDETNKPIVFINKFNNDMNVLVNIELHEIGKLSWDLLKKSDRPLFNKGPIIVSPITTDEGNIILSEYDTQKMKGVLSEEIIYVKLKISKGNIVPEILPSPKSEYAEYILKNCDSTELPAVHSVIGHPFLYREPMDKFVNPDKYTEFTNSTKLYQYTIINEHGIHKSGVFVNPNTSVDIKPYDTLEKADNIIKDIFRDFPYGDDSSLSNTVSQLITGVCRYAMGTDMPPIALTTSQTHGSGKTMETDVIHAILYGTTTNWNPKIKTLDEYRKTLLTCALSGSPMVCFDNLNEKLDIETLASAATARRLSGRILHTMTNVDVANYMQICINGTAMDISTEIADRTIWKVMHTDEKAATREFKYTALIDNQVIPNRKYILSAVFTYIQKWIEKGCPICEVKQQKHRSKVWAGLIGGILKDTIWYCNFLENTDRQRIESDTKYVRWTHSIRELARHIKCMPGEKETFSFGIKDTMLVLSYLEKCTDKDCEEKYPCSHIGGSNMLGEDIGTESKNDQSRSTKLGVLFTKLSKNGGTPFGNWKIKDAGQFRRRRNFKLEWIGEDDIIPPEFIMGNSDEDDDDGLKL